MAKPDVADKLALLSVEDDLTCSICLCLFDSPVTIPCGHNFCQDCISTTWKDAYSCPQCRRQFAFKPELRKNTALSSLVDTFSGTSARSKMLPLPGEEVQIEMEPAVLCDLCTVKASKTCLTCVASFCEHHLKPHLENPNLRIHQLSEPLENLLEHICPNHHKLLEFYCVEHAHCICSLCLQNVHRGCTFSTPAEQKGIKESDLRNKLHLLDGKIEMNQMAISQIEDLETKLKDAAANKKRAFAAEYQRMREMLDRDEHEAMCTVDREQETCRTKLRGPLNKFTQNVEKMSSAKDSITNLLGQSHTMAFLQTSVDLPPVVNFTPYTPRINLDSKTLGATQLFTATLKNYLTDLFQQSVEARLQILQPRQGPIFTSPAEHLQSPSPGAPLRIGQKKKPQKQPAKPSHAPREKKGMRGAYSMENILDLSKAAKPRGRSSPEPKRTPETTDIPPNISAAEKRHALLKYGTVLTLDPKTAHKRIKLSENLMTASVSDEVMAYPDNPARFSVCSQVLTSKGFSRGCHYWEVKLSSLNFVGMGLAYNSIDRKGPASRLGRNAQSWCVEWFNITLSAWHDGKETALANPSPNRVGVLLNCDEGSATFYKVADRVYPFHTFVFPFAEAVYPAFWIFPSGSSIALCSLQA